MPDHGSQEPRKGDYSSATQPMPNRMRSVKFDCGFEPPLSLNLPPGWIGHEASSGATIVDACTRYVTIDTNQAAPK